MNRNTLNSLLKIICCTFFLQLVFAQSSDVWVSDEIEAPLRESPNLSAKIISLLPAGIRVTTVEKQEGYTKIKTQDGTEGWLSNYYVLQSQSVHDRLVPTEKKLAATEKKIKEITEELNAKNTEIKLLKDNLGTAENKAINAEKTGNDNQILQDKLATQSKKMAELAKALDAAKEKASDAKTRYLRLVKISENAVDIDKQNRSLQEKSVKFEKEIQRLKNENQTLSSQIGNKEKLIGGLMVLGGVILGFILTKMMPPKRRRSSTKYGAF